MAEPITVAAALERILAATAPLPAATVDLAEASGLVLAEDIASDIDSPPFDKAMVDGYAVRAADLVDGRGELIVVEEVMAGSVPSKHVGTGEATRIMTGAPLPEGADAVVMVERTELVALGAGLARVRIGDESLRMNQNISRRGCALQCGEVVLRAGAVLRPIEIGLLAEVGRTRVPVIPRPRVAVLATGDELVPVDRTPSAGQIRNSNEPTLLAAVARAGGQATGLGVARDELEELRRLVRQGLEADVLVLSGGVSAGVLDLVPQVLAECGVEQVFHKVRIKPGKPIWFGVKCGQPSDKLVFGLPGNPVSSFVCCELFVRPALEKLAGRADGGLRADTARLAADFRHRGDRTSYLPAVAMRTDAGISVSLVRSQGSGDLRAMTLANALACFPSGERAYAAGDLVEIRWLD